MGSEWIIGALAFMTIGGILGLSIFHFGFHLKDPKNMEATKRVTADRESATTEVSAEGVGGRSLRQRLDEAPSINDRLSKRPTGTSSAWGVLFDTKVVGSQIHAEGLADRATPPPPASRRGADEKAATCRSRPSVAHKQATASHVLADATMSTMRAGELSLMPLWMTLIR